MIISLINSLIYPTGLHHEICYYNNFRNSSLFKILRDVKQPTHCLKRVGHGFPLLFRSLAKCGRLGVMFPERLVVYEATHAKTATSQREVTEC